MLLRKGDLIWLGLAAAMMPARGVKCPKTTTLQQQQHKQKMGLSGWNANKKWGPRFRFCCMMFIYNWLNFWSQQNLRWPPLQRKPRKHKSSFLLIKYDDVKLKFGVFVDESASTHSEHFKVSWDLANLLAFAHHVIYKVWLKLAYLLSKFKTLA